MKKRIAIFGSSKFETIEYHIADSLNHLGHEVKIFDYNSVFTVNKKIDYWLRRFSENISAKIAKKIAEKVALFKPDIVIATYRDIHPAFVETIKEKTNYNIPCIHINPDALTTFQNQQIFASNYDYYFTKDPFMVDFMRNKMSLNTHLLPESFNPRVHKKPDGSKVDLENEIGIDVLVFGSMYPYRTNMIKKLIDADINVTMYGSKGPFFPSKLEPYFKNRKILGEEKSKLIYGSKIVFNNFHYAEVEGVNCKFFELNGVGAFQLCDYKDSISEYLNYGADQVTFKTIDEAIEKIKFYLKSENATLRYKLSEENRRHFSENHTYEHRMEQVFKTIGF